MKSVISTNEEKGAFKKSGLKPINQYYFVKPDCLRTGHCTIKCGSWKQGFGEFEVDDHLISDFY